MSTQRQPTATDAGDGMVATRGTASVLLPPDSPETPDISLVIPTLNEEAGIGECIESAVEAFRELGVAAEVIVSDSSTDRTPQIAREHGARVVHPDGEGYGYAYLYGFRHARGDLVAMGDGDTTYDFGELPGLVRTLEEEDADLVLGSRLEGETKPGAMPTLHRLVGNPVLTRFLNVFYGAGVSDAHSGMRVFRSALLEELDLEAHGMEFASEMIMQASSRGLAIEEVPITYHERAGEEKLDTFRDGWRHVKFMLLNAPSHLFAGPGAALGIAGLCVMALSLLGFESGVTFSSHTMIAGSLLTIVGYQVSTLAVFTTITTDPIRRQRDRITRLICSEFTLERGLTGGTLVVLTGGAVAAYLLRGWLATGTPPSVLTAIVALTAIVIGLQTVFHSFFLSMLAGTGTDRDAIAGHHPETDAAPSAPPTGNVAGSMTIHFEDAE